MPTLRSIIIRYDIRRSTHPIFFRILHQFGAVATLRLDQFSLDNVAQLGRVILALTSLKHLTLDGSFTRLWPTAIPPNNRSGIRLQSLLVLLSEYDANYCNALLSRLVEATICGSVHTLTIKRRRRRGSSLASYDSEVKLASDRLLQACGSSLVQVSHLYTDVCNGLDCLGFPIASYVTLTPPTILQISPVTPSTTLHYSS